VDSAATGNAGGRTRQRGEREQFSISRKKSSTVRSAGFTVRVNIMQRDLPSAPDLLQRATHGEPAALSALLCARKERACELARTLSLSGDGDVPDVPASMEELADSCAHRRSSPAAAPRRSAEPSSGTFALGAGANDMDERVSAYMQRALLRRWQLVSALCHALVGLSYEQRAVLVLLDVEELETDQVGWLMGFSEAEVRALVFPARAALRAQLLTGRYVRNSA
jgi:hypothetical protein